MLRRYLRRDALPDDAVDDDHAQEQRHGLALVLNKATAPSSNGFVDVAGTDTLHCPASSPFAGLATRSRRAAAHDVRKVQGKNNAKCREVHPIMSEQSIDASSTDAWFETSIPILTKLNHILQHEDSGRQAQGARS